jgi:DtxR family Mn-dependent transcriptional regulator
MTEPNPLLAILVAILAAAAAVALLWPDRGLYWRWRRSLHANERVLLEDALKHLFDADYKGKIASLESLSGALSVSGNRAAELLKTLEERELAEPIEGGYRLTSEGRSYALRVVRIHRLWERYLSDETGLDPRAWHDEAEVREHRTSAAEADALAAALGHPRFDPHGDPIPTPEGEIMPAAGRPLTETAVGTLVELVHVEDEPAAVYDQLVAEGLHPGMKIRLLDSDPRRLRLEVDAEEHVLAPVVAANLWVQPLPEEERMEGPFVRLSSLEPGEEATVLAISPAVRGAERRRLFDLGLLPGTKVAAEMRSPSGDPTGYRIRGALIALRRAQADGIRIEKLGSEAA